MFITFGAYLLVSLLEFSQLIRAMPEVSIHLEEHSNGAGLGPQRVDGNCTDDSLLPWWQQQHEM